MIRGLYGRLALVLLTMFLLSGVILFYIYERTGRQLQQQVSQQLHLNLASYLVQDTQLYDQGKLDQSRVKEVFSKVMMLAPGTELYIIDAQGKVLAYDAPANKIIQHQINLAPIRRMMEKQPTLPVLGDDPRSQRQKVFSVAPIYNARQELQSYLYIIIQGEIHDSVTALTSNNKNWIVSLSLLVAALLFLLLTTLLLFYKFTRPLARLKRKVTTFEHAEFRQLPPRHHPPANGAMTQGDEIQQLDGSFQRMAQKIITQIETLQKHDQLRREFLAHVSHDLRTPLTGMQAYLETLQLQGDDLSAEERANFLCKALSSHQQLTHMINQLFELARLEHGQIEMRPEAVLLADLLSDLYATLGDLASDRGIYLAVEMPHTQLMVYADLASLERILQNLISNAISYTPAGGKITIQVQADTRQKITISVHDTGQGIPADDLPYIFEPYFRSHNARSIRQKGHGLGLAIVRELLTLQGSELKVASEPGVGSRFWFSLQAA